MGRFSSIGRREKAPKGKAEVSPTESSGTARVGQKSWPKTSVSGAATRSPDPNSKSQEHQSAAGEQARAQGDKNMATIGQSIVFKGELTGDEDLEIDGRVEGTVDLKNHQLTIGANGNLKAEVTAKSIIVIGKVTGNLVAAERIEIQATGIVDGDVRAPRLNVQEGAVLNGRIDMSGGTTSDTAKPASKSSSSTSSAASPASANPATATI